MSSTAVPHAWIVEIDGRDRRVSVDIDGETGRAQIRVDGRMAARALAPNEAERRFTIGAVAYVVRRDQAGVFSLDLDEDLPDAPAPAAAVEDAPGRRKSRVHRQKIVALVATLLMFPLADWVIDTVRYLRVPWQVHVGHANQFRISFPGKPEEVRSKTKNFRTTKLSARYHDHLYVLEWIDLPVRIAPVARRDVVSRALDAMIESEGARVVNRGLAPEGTPDAAHFILEMPENETWGGGTARGHVVAFNNRIYIQYAYVPRGESLSYDVGEYLRSLDLPEE